MNRRHPLRSVHHVRALLARLPHQPVIPPHAPNHQRRHLRIEPARKREVINRPSRLLHSAFVRQPFCAALPRCIRKVQWLGDSPVPPPAHHHQPPVCPPPPRPPPAT